MRRIVLYECGKCHIRSENAAEIEACEAGHLGVTREVLLRHKRLSAAFANCMARESYTRNADIMDASDKALDALMAFEKNHGLARD